MSTTASHSRSRCKSCDQQGCYGETSLSAGFLTALKGGKRLSLTFQNMSKSNVVLPVPLDNFAEAFQRIQQLSAHCECRRPRFPVVSRCNSFDGCSFRISSHHRHSCPALFIFLGRLQGKLTSVVGSGGVMINQQIAGNIGSSVPGPHPPRPLGGVALSANSALLGSSAAANAFFFEFTSGDLVISTVSCQVGAACNSTSGGLDTASPMTLQEFSLNGTRTIATAAGSLTLPQTPGSGGAPISGEYGSASEGILTFNR